MVGSHGWKTTSTIPRTQELIHRGYQTASSIRFLHLLTFMTWIIELCNICLNMLEPTNYLFITEILWRKSYGKWKIHTSIKQYICLFSCSTNLQRGPPSKQSRIPQSYLAGVNIQLHVHLEETNRLHRNVLKPGGNPLLLIVSWEFPRWILVSSNSQVALTGSPHKVWIKRIQQQPGTHSGCYGEKLTGHAFTIIFGWF